MWNGFSRHNILTSFMYVLVSLLEKIVGVRITWVEQSCDRASSLASLDMYMVTRWCCSSCNEYAKPHLHRYSPWATIWFRYMHFFFLLITLTRFVKLSSSSVIEIWILVVKFAVRIGIIYLLSGLGGTVLSSLFIRSSISVGASGALFGLLGSMLSELLTNWTIYSNKVNFSIPICSSL